MINIPPWKCAELAASTKAASREKARAEGTACEKPADEAARTLPLSTSAATASSVSPAPLQAALSCTSQPAARTSPAAWPMRKPSPRPAVRHVTAPMQGGSSISQPPSSRQTQTAPKRSPDTKRPPGVTRTAETVVTWPMYMVPVHSLHSWPAKARRHRPSCQRRTVMSALPVATRSPSPPPAAAAKHVTSPRWPPSTVRLQVSGRSAPAPGSKASSTSM
mmetsp:Transcript_50489/g.146511  ORF Transcript_50489/g.146511 Transcript_50489/m.146511 type:complete len:220 (+) Transcript_50489:315-974(+)